MCRRLDCVRLAPRLSEFLGPGRSDLRRESREMLAAHNWLVPMYDGQPFFDKPPLFYILQMASFACSARRSSRRASSRQSPPSRCWWSSRGSADSCSTATWDERRADVRRAPGHFALSSYAIVDMTFTLFLFGGCSFITGVGAQGSAAPSVSRLSVAGCGRPDKGAPRIGAERPRVRAGLAFAPDARRPLLRCAGHRRPHRRRPCAPWFLYMWRRFGTRSSTATC